MATVTINGQTFSGNNISIVNGNVVIDGKPQDGDQLTGVVEVRVVEGTLGELHSDASVSCNDVAGNVFAGGSVQCDDVGGNVQSGGSVRCDDVGGNIMAGGSVRHG